MNVQGREGARYYSILPSTGVTSQPVLLTTTDGIIEDATSASIAKDGRTLFYTTNDGDIDRRHIWSVPTNGSAPPKRVSPGDGIETFPMPLASGQRFAAFSADYRRPQSVAVFQVATGEQRVIYPTLPARFPTRGARQAGGRHAEGRRRRRVLQPAVRAEGSQAG